ncbi:Bifunctional protein GlmU [Hartmannibacter diazotrophicus]|uniref:Bifunctional protein GlmU n=1 Tax=Hartmannibacter diazotrophicus TaxID=1482074 RepID=A0A2C9CZQ4_9HYPH|nr:nucleotidyltransferase family protein [Hartmannibacter diazotrophicus]SON53572.1 Bifunctional protein GlmU [Hartmannibacter diazotrophicus]
MSTETRHPISKSSTISIPRKAMVLAAGRGKRMRPLSATTPKPLIEVMGKALVDHVLDRLVEAGVETAVVNVHYLADLVEVHVSKRQAPEIVVSDERKRLLDTGGGVVKALPHLGSEPFFHLNSDSIWIEGIQPNLMLLAEHFDADRMDMLLLLAPTVSSVGYDGVGDFVMDKNGLLSRRPQRDVAPFVYAGAAIIHPRVFAGETETAFSLNRLFDRAIDAGRLYGIRMEGIWLHVGTPRAIGEAEATIAASAA